MCSSDLTKKDNCYWLDCDDSHASLSSFSPLFLHYDKVTRDDILGLCVCVCVCVCGERERDVVSSV